MSGSNLDGSAERARAGDDPEGRVPVAIVTATGPHRSLLLGYSRASPHTSGYRSTLATIRGSSGPGDESGGLTVRPLGRACGPARELPPRPSIALQFVGPPAVLLAALVASGPVTLFQPRAESGPPRCQGGAAGPQDDTPADIQLTGKARICGTEPKLLFDGGLQECGERCMESWPVNMLVARPTSRIWPPFSRHPQARTAQR
nr:uncharacterized protein LOC126517899 [Dermacentor andersoni]